LQGFWPNVLAATNVVREVGTTLNEYVYLRSWQQKFGFLYRDIQMVRSIMYLVMVLVIGVASFNIVSTLMMAVKDRAAEIARVFWCAWRRCRQCVRRAGGFKSINFYLEISTLWTSYRRK